MRIYVAASRQGIALAKSTMHTLRSMGHTITYDWTEAIERNPPDNDCTDEVMRNEARADYRGVETASLIVILAPETGGTGMWVEMGIACAMGIAVAYVGPFRTIFQYLNRVVVFATVRDFLRDFPDLFNRD